jgi:pyruvate dehydrogenase E2 component (dihydrolipoamide acetyltransferase)
VQEGVELPIGALIAVVGDPGEKIPESVLAEAGARGKVMKEDVLRAAGRSAPPKPAPSAASPERSRGVEGAGKIVPLSPMRRLIARRVSESKQTIPSYYLEMDADVTELVDLRSRLNAEGKPKVALREPQGDPEQGRRVAFNDFVIKACGKALRLFSAVNSRWGSGGVERRSEVNIGLAVALDEGLLVPVVCEADKKSVRQIAAETADLAARARANRLRPDEYQDGCMTITSLGMFGIRSFIPIVNPGESTILGLGMIEDRVVARQGTIEIRKVMTLTLAVDHRLVDGAVGAQFLETVRDLLEAPQKLVD